MAELTPSDSLERFAAQIVDDAILSALEIYGSLRNFDISYGDEENKRNDDEQENDGEEEEEEEEDEEESDEKLEELWSLKVDDEEYYDVHASDIPTDARYNYKFCYNYQKLRSKPIMSSTAALPNNLLILHSTYGYDCVRQYNLISVDMNVLAYLAGNYVVFFNHKLNKRKYIRSIAGTGLSAIAIDSNKRNFVTGERGRKPTINVFEYPSFRLIRMLKNGAEKSFAYLDFSSDSTQLASLGGEPDYTLAIWDWSKEQITWRCKAFSQDVFKVIFSTEFPDKLISSGVGHIKFWTMADTFTGCKLQGVLGKFDHVEISDIRGFTELSGNRALSGSEWGNILLWEDGICIAEITRKGKTCHAGSIEQIVNDNGSILTVGVDGYIRAWDIEGRIGERNEEQLKWEMDPLDEIKIGKKSQLMNMVKVDKASAVSETGVWFVQDLHGMAWMIDLSFQLNAFEPKCLMSCHAGPVYSCVTSPVSEFLATGGEDCTIRIYDYNIDSQVCTARYNSSATSLVWLPASVDSTGGLMVAGFNDGVVRMLRFQQKKDVKNPVNIELKLCDVIKPHNDTVTKLSFNESTNVLVSGSKDKTVFFFKLNQTNNKLNRIGFVQTPTPVVNLAWIPPNIEKSLIVSCTLGNVMKVDVSNLLTFDNTRSYQLVNIFNVVFTFRSRKSLLLHEEEMRKYEMEKKGKKPGTSDPNCKDCEKLKEDNEEEEEEEFAIIEDLWEQEVPAVPNNVLFALHTDDPNRFWVSMDESDCGYLYECSFDSTDNQDILFSFKLTPVFNTTVHCYLYHETSKHLILGTGDGSILIYESPDGKPNTMANYYLVGVHDSKDGKINDLSFSFDQKFLFSVGSDGNVFAFAYNDSPSVTDPEVQKSCVPPYQELPDIEDITDSSAASLEDSMTMKRMMESKLKAEENKKMKMEQLKKMQKKFKELFNYNNKLPYHLRLHNAEYEMDKRFSEEAQKMKEEKLEMAEKQLLFENVKVDITLSKVQERYTGQVEFHAMTISGFQISASVSSYRLAKVSAEMFEKMNNLVSGDSTHKSKMTAKSQGSKIIVTDYSPEGAGEETIESLKDANKLLYEKLKKMGNQGVRKVKMFEKVETFRAMREKRKKEWDEFLKSEPRYHRKTETEDESIASAKSNLGDMKLKAAVGDKITSDKQKMTLEKSTFAYITHLSKQNQLMKEYNKLVLDLRSKKRTVIIDWTNAQKQLSKLHQKIPTYMRRRLPNIEVSLLPAEFPELKYEKYETNPYTVSLPSYLGITPTVTVSEAGMSQKFVPDTFKGMNNIEEQIAYRSAVESFFLQEEIITDIENEIKFFDAEVLFLRSIKFSVDVFLKQGELRELLLLQELLKMVDMIKQEEMLVDILDSKVRDEIELQKKIEELIQKIEKCQKEAIKLTAQQVQMEKNFLSIIPDNYKFNDFLVKVYKQKIKRRMQIDHKSAGLDDDEEDDDEDDEDDDEEDDDDNYDDEDDNYMNLDICPEGCNIALFEKTVQMREGRLDVMEKITEYKKMREAAVKELEVKKKIVKTAQEEATKAALNVDLYQVAKLRAVNEFHAVVVLSFKQIECLDEENETIASDFNDVLVVDLPQLKFLEHRIHELEKECQLQLKNIKDTQEKHWFLTRSKARMTKKIAEVDEEMKGAMVRKFGKMVSLEKMETILVSPVLEELMHDFDATKLQNQEELAHIEKEISEMEAKQSREIKLNTDIINYTLAYKDVADELASDLSKKQGEMVMTRQPNPVNLHEVVKLTEEQMKVIIDLKREKYKLLYCPSGPKRF